MALTHSPSIVTNGLQAYVDPANSKCFANGENLLQYSEQANNAVWGKAEMTVSADVIASPINTITADKLVETATTSAYHFRNQAVTKTATAITYTYSLYVKDGGGGAIGLRIDDGASNGAVVTYNITSANAGAVITAPGTYGTFTNASSTFTSVGNGWHRISLTTTSNASTTTIYVQEYLWNIAANSSVYTGNVSNGVFVWGAQFEYNSAPSDYIQTLGAVTTRSRTLNDLSGNNRNATNYPTSFNTQSVYYDPITKSLIHDGVDDQTNIPNFSYPATWSDPWTLSVWMYVPTGAIWANANRASLLLRGTYAGHHGLYRNNINNEIGVSVRGTTTFNVVITTITRDAWWNVTGTWSGTNLTLYTNGTQAATTAATPDGTPGSATWQLGGNEALAGAAGSYYAGKLASAMIYNRTLTSAEITQNFNALRGRFGI